MESSKSHDDPAERPTEKSTPTSESTFESKDKETREEDEEQQYREISAARSSFWVDDLGDGHVIRFKTTGTTWKAGGIFSERELRDYYIPEASALCVATQVDGPNPGSKAMLRIREQIPTDDSDTDETGSLKLGDHAEVELNYLRYLTEKNCTCTPKLIDYEIEAQGKNDNVPGGFRLYILMEKVPGRNLMNFGELEMAERDQVRIAFAKALYEFCDMGLIQEDCHRRNLMWDRKNKKVYIVDLESASHHGVIQRSVAREFYYWGLAGVSADDEEVDIDPMVPHRDAFDECGNPSEEELIEMAAASMGKSTRSRRY
ncbi:hypothetical protein FQN54_000654 [Arachnomyces sp. PD_36]|nr:hypothetical protein FQN54_000654 [Arachnomyces sp. PD_36]